MAKLIPWLFLIPPALVTLAAIATLLHARTPRGRALKHFRQGGDCFFQKNLKEAEAEFRMGLELFADHPPLVGSLAALLVETERFEEAIPVLAKARSLDPGDMRLILLEGRCHQGLEASDKALEAWGSIPEESDIFADAMGLVSEELERQGNLEGAAQSLKRAIERSTLHRSRPYKKELKRLEVEINAPSHP